MNQDLVSVEQKQHIASILDQAFNENEDIGLISISTTDGFSIYTINKQELTIEVDKLAAMSSALCSLSSASAEQLTKDGLRMATVETEKGNILFRRAEFYHLSCVVSMVGKSSVSLAEARFVLKRLTDAVEKLH